MERGAERETRAADQPPAEMLKLCSRVRDNYKGLKITPAGVLSLAGGKTLDLDDVFVRLMIVPHTHGKLRKAFDSFSFGSALDGSRRLGHVFNDLHHDSDLQLVLLKELFPPCNGREPARKISVRVLLLASGGCGKTTLMSKYCPLKWAVGMLWSDKFDLVICAELRSENIRRATGIGDLLGGWGSFGIESESQRQTIADYLYDYSHRLCIILDGLDEASLEQCSEFVQGLIRGKKLAGVRLILTSRHCRDVLTLAEQYPFDQCVELIGFLRADIREYVRKVLPPPKAKELISRLGKDYQLESVMTTPFFAAAVCELVTWNNEVPRCMSDILELMILRLLSQRTHMIYRCWSSLPVELQSNVLDLGEFAMTMLLEQRLCFTDDDLLLNSVSKQVLALGFLVTCGKTANAAVPSEHQWRFSHLALQEGLAAHFVAHKGPMFPEKIATMVKMLGPLSGHLNMFWPLLAARLTEECMESLADALLTQPHSPSDDPQRLRDVLRNQYAVPVWMVEMLGSRLLRPSMERLADWLLDDIVDGCPAIVVANKMLQHSSRSTNDMDYLRNVLHTWTRLCPGACTEKLLGALDRVDGSTAEVIRSKQTEPVKKVQENSPEINARRLLVFQCFYEYSQHKTSGAVPLVPVSRIKDLLVSSGVHLDTTMKQADCLILRHVIEHHASHITKIQLQAPARSVKEWQRLVFYELRKCPNVQELRVEIYQQPGHAEIFMSMLNKLIESCHLLLKVFRVAFISGCIPIATLRALESCEQLRRLDIPCPFEEDLLEGFSRTVKALTLLENLHIWFWLAGLSDYALPKLKESLLCLKRLLHARFDCLSASCLPTVAELIRSWPSLESLHLSRIVLSHTTEEESTTFLEAVASSQKISQIVFSCKSFATDNPFSERLLQEASYPKSVDLVLEESK